MLKSIMKMLPVLLLGIPLSGFSLDPVILSNIQAAPLEYTNQTLVVQGYIVEKHHLPFSIIRIYKVFDNTESITVISLVEGKDRKKNSRAAFQGKIFFFGGDNVASAGKEFIETMKKMLMDAELVKDPEKARKVSERSEKFLERTFRGEKYILCMIENDKDRK